jgi:hypothetical protein
MIRKYFIIFLCFFMFYLTTHNGFAQDNGVSIGYGFGALNRGMKGIQIRDGNYDYIQLTYLHEKPFYKRINYLIEPHIAYINRPSNGIDIGFSLSLKGYLNEDKKGFFGTVGVGTIYTTLGYSGQGTHLLGILQGGIGYKWKNYFIENRFKHYSNAGTAYPNRSINSNMISFGIIF